VLARYKTFCAFNLRQHQRNLSQKSFGHNGYLSFCPFVILAVCHFGHLAFWPFGILAIWHFGHLAFWPFAILSNRHGSLL
jgi:hypothetical protein